MARKPYSFERLAVARKAIGEDEKRKAMNFTLIKKVRDFLKSSSNTSAHIKKRLGPDAEKYFLEQLSKPNEFKLKQEVNAKASRTRVKR